MEWIRRIEFTEEQNRFFVYPDENACITFSTTADEQHPPQTPYRIDTIRMEMEEVEGYEQ